MLKYATHGGLDPEAESAAGRGGKKRFTLALALDKLVGEARPDLVVEATTRLGVLEGVEGRANACRANRHEGRKGDNDEGKEHHRYGPYFDKQSTDLIAETNKKTRLLMSS